MAWLSPFDIGGRVEARGDGGISRDMLTAGSWFIRPVNSASEGRSPDLIGRGTGRGGVAVRPTPSGKSGLCRGDDACLASNGRDVTLLMGVVAMRLGDGWLPKKVFDDNSSGECDAAAEAGLDCATPP